jgi:hypothetical protein
MNFQLRTARLYNVNEACQLLGKSLFFRGACLMANGNPLEPEDERQPPKKQTKKPYTKPAFRFERVFETQALSCGKVSSSNQCSIHRKTS